MNARVIGFVVMALGAVSTIYFLVGFDVSVVAPTTEILGTKIGGERVNNLGLLNDRQNGIMVSLAVTLIGALFAIFGDRSTSRAVGQGRRVQGGIECPNCRLISPAGAITCDCGYKLA